MEKQTTEPEEVPTLQTPGTTFRLTELKIKIDSLARESWFIRLQENKLKRGYHRSQSKIISKYLEKDEDFVDDAYPSLNDLQGNFKLSEKDALKTYEKLRMKRRYQKAINIAKEKHPEVFIVDKLKTYISAHQNLHGHRVNIVSVETRECLLAYGFIRGRAYAKIETDPRWKWHYDRPEPNWENVANIVYRFTSVPNRKEVVVGTRHMPDGSTKDVTKSAVLINLEEEIKRWKGN